MSDCSFKKEVTLKKHKNTKHYQKSCPSNKGIGAGQVGFISDVIPGKEKDADIDADEVDSEIDKNEDEESEDAHTFIVRF